MTEFIKNSWIPYLLFILFSCTGNSAIKTSGVDDYLKLGLEYFQDRKYQKAIEEFTYIIYNAPVSEYADDAQFYIGESHFQLKEYILAISEYQRLIRTHPQSPLVEDARFKIGLSYFKLSPKYYHDQENTYKAIESFQEFLEDFPGSKYRDEAQQKIDICR
ncbi:MAG: outer membrane protein assembly factor BamD, partial [Fidelibacterota bacterium]